MDFDKIKNGDSPDTPGTELEETNESPLAKIRKARGIPEAPYEPRCDCCNSPYREFIDAMILRDVKYIEIADKVPGKDGKVIDRRSVSKHAKKHLGVQEGAMRSILEEEAMALGKNVEDGTGTLITHRGILKAALKKGYEAIATGDTVVEPRDLIQLINLERAMDEQTQEIAVNHLKAQVDAFTQAIKHETSPEVWDRIFKRFRKILQDEGLAPEDPKEIEEVITDVEVVG